MLVSFLVLVTRSVAQTLWVARQSRKAVKMVSLFPNGASATQELQQ
jgi:hypothetical protein